MLQLPCGCTEAIENPVLCYTIDPVSSGWEYTAQEVSALTLTRTETPHDLREQGKDDLNTIALDSIRNVFQCALAANTIISSIPQSYMENLWPINLAILEGGLGCKRQSSTS